MKKVFLAAVLLSFAVAAQAQQRVVQLPDHLKGAAFQTATSESVRPFNVVPVEPAPSALRKANTSRPAPAVAGQTQVGVMANTFGTLGLTRNQIACDPATGSVAVIYRGNDRSGNSVGNTLYVRYSTDAGATWSAPGTNIANSASPRYPNIGMINPTQSPNTADVKVSILWPQVVNYAGATATWGEVNSLAVGIGSTGKKYQKFPTPPNWSIPTRIMGSAATGKLYTWDEALEPSNGQGTGGYHLLVSTDQGQTWNTMDPNLNPQWNDTMIPADASVYGIAADVSPDGTHMIFAWLSAKVVDNSVSYINSEHSIAYIESVDGGTTWTTEPAYLQLQDIPNLPVPLNVNAGLGIAPQLSVGDFDVAYDSQNNPHFLVTASTDQNPYDPLASGTDTTFSIAFVDSTFLCEVGRSGGSWYLNEIAPLKIIRGFRYSFVQEVSTGNFRPETIYHEPMWAVSSDGNKMYAKWVEVDSTLKWPYAAVNSQNQLVLFQDTIRNMHVAGRDIRSMGAGGGWSAEQKVTSNTDVDVKYSKLAHYAGNGGELHAIYTEWGVGERPDDDPNNADCPVWYVNGVKVSVVADVEKVDGAPGAFALGRNYPNPFNPSTEIEFTLPTAGRATMKVYNMLGRDVATIFDMQLQAGTHRATFDAGTLPSGTYIYRLESGNLSASRTMTLMK